jgi:beta-mannanase
MTELSKRKAGVMDLLNAPKLRRSHPRRTIGCGCAIVASFVLSIAVLLGGGAGVAAAASPIALGINTAGISSNTAAALEEFKSQTGASPKIAMWYQDWDEQWSTALLNPRFTVPAVERGATPMVTWEPDLSAAGTSHQPEYSLAEIAAGRFDKYILRAARETAAYKKPVFIRLAEEMNGSWSSWGAGVDGNTPASFIAMWRHVVSIFRLAGATNVAWVWSPNIHQTGGSARTFQQYYPGNAWVTDVGLDGYNFGQGKGTSWQSFSRVFEQSYAELAALTNKPMMIAETASAEEGGNKAAWIESIPQVIATTMPRVRALIWFNRDKEVDWRVNSSSASLAAFRKTLQSGFFSGGIGSLTEGLG